MNIKDFSGVRLFSLAVIFVCLIGLTGCNQEQVARATHAVEIAQQALERGQVTIAELRAQVDQYRPLAEAVGGERGKELVAAFDQRLIDAEKALPALQTAVDQASEGLELAKRQAGWSQWLLWGVGAAATLMGGGGIAAVRIGSRTRTALGTAVQLADALRPLAEKQDPQATSAAVEKAAEVQSATRTREIVRTVRNKSGPAPRLSSSSSDLARA